jgi:prepilin-type N-terminal cleavage/methylation domain-containing protein
MMTVSVFDRTKRITDEAKGFTFIEVAIVLFLVGLLAGGGVLVFGKNFKSAKRKEAVEHLQAVKRSLLLWAQGKAISVPPTLSLNNHINGFLPLADNGTYPASPGGGLFGVSESPVSTSLPYVTLGVSKTDPWGNAVRYVVSRDIDSFQTSPVPGNGMYNWPNDTGRNAICRWTRDDSLTQGPLYYDEDTGVTKRVAAVIVSGGPSDLNSDDAGFFDKLAGHTAANEYSRARPSDTYDDLVVAITAPELYHAIREAGFCAYDVTVNNVASGTTAYLWDVTKGRDVGIVGNGASIKVRVDLDDVLVVRNDANGGGTVLPSTVATPVTVTSAITLSLP